MFCDGLTMEKRNDSYVGVRIPQTLKNLIHEIVALDAHLNEADFVRDAIREKIQRDAPELYRRLFQEASKK